MNDIQIADGIFEKFLHSKGLRYTRERKIVLRTIMRIEGHFTLIQLLSKLKRSGGIHRATLYRMLPLLEEGKIIRRSMSSEIGEWRYEHLVGHEHHDHLICVRCGKVIEFYSKRIEDEQDRLRRKYGFLEMGHQFSIRGVCSECSKRGRKKK
ncbi:Fur family transcriptional regulator [Planctomycetota bacterium]